jgi:GNAT superfamily N-acetyltransferase
MRMSPAGIEARVATLADADGLSRTMSAALYADPVWSWAFPDPQRRAAQLDAWWRLYVGGAIRYSWVWTTPAYEAAAVWIPPGGTELSDAEEALVEPLLSDLLGARSGLVLSALESFEAAHPRDQPHYYLSLLGTHPDHRGRGLGMGLVAANLGRIDQDHMPAYLESSNPANISRYERAGFVPRGQFSVSDGGPVVTTMWRAPR